MSEFSAALKQAQERTKSLGELSPDEVEIIRQWRWHKHEARHCLMLVKMNKDRVEILNAGVQKIVDLT